MLQTYEATYETGWRASVRDDNARSARRRLRQMGRGERFTMTAGGSFNVWGNDSDDDYEDGE